MKPITKDEAAIISDVTNEIIGRTRVGLSIKELKESVDWLQDFVQDCYSSRVHEDDEK